MGCATIGSGTLCSVAETAGVGAGVGASTGAGAGVGAAKVD